MLTAIQTKLLIAMTVLLAGIASYFAYERHLQTVERQKVNRAFQRMRTEGQQTMPANWAKALKNK